MLVMPPGIAGVILSLHRCCFVLSVLGQQKESSTNRLFSDSPGRFPHTVLIQSWISCLSIHLLSRFLTMTPSGKFSSRRVFLLKLTNDNFPPSSAVHANMTVCQVFISFPVVFMLTVLVPFKQSL